MALVLSFGVSCNDGSREPGDTSTAGAAGAAGAAGSSARGPQCAGVPELKPSCDCSPEQHCFALSDGYEVCSAPNQQEATSCSGSTDPMPADQCGCAGAVCPQGQACRKIHDTVAGGSFDQNRCYAVCQSDADCTAGQSCLPDRFDVPTCITAECSSDADCSEDDCGHCVRERWMGFQGAVWGNAPRCVYEGKADSSSCRGSGFLPTDGSLPSYYRSDVHTCHAWTVDGAQP